MADYALWIPGDPKPMPRPKVTTIGGHGRAYYPATGKAWRDAVAKAVAASLTDDMPWTCAVAVSMVVILPRPKSHYTSKGELRANAPAYPIAANTGDLDNYEKLIYDAITEKRRGGKVIRRGVIVNDSQIVEYAVPFRKEYAGKGWEPGIEFNLWRRG